MRVIIAGSRTVVDLALVEHAMHEAGYYVEEVISGGAEGADRLGEEWAAARRIPVRRILPGSTYETETAWKVRNVVAVREADALVALWDGASPGTADIIKKARARGIHVRPRDRTATRGLRPRPLDTQALELYIECMSNAATLYVVTGNTYAHADSLRRLGLSWDAGRRAWTTTDAEAAGKVNPTYLGRRAGRELTVKAITLAAVPVLCPACGTYCYGDCKAN